MKKFIVFIFSVCLLLVGCGALDGTSTDGISTDGSSTDSASESSVIESIESLESVGSSFEDSESLESVESFESFESFDASDFTDVESVSSEDYSFEESSSEESSSEESSFEETSSEESSFEESSSEENSSEETSSEESSFEETSSEESSSEETSSEESSSEESSSEESSSEESSPEETHYYEGTVTAPTCENDGYTTYTCATCGDSYVDDRVEALGHDYKTSVTAPTCEDDGYTTYTCATCGDSYMDDAVDALQHSWVDATTESPKTCVLCGKTEGEKLPLPATLDTLYVNYINVGQGDSILIKVDDCDILIDAGKPNQGTVVSNYLKSQGVDDIELMINTHLDDDHYGGLSQVLTDFEVEEVWGTPFSKSNSSITTFKNAVKKEGLTIKNPSVGTIFTYEYLTLTVLYDGVGASNSNNSSLLVMLQYGSFRFLFTGDIGEETENKLVNNSNIDLSCDVLKVGHHGSATSSTAAFLKATQARYGVICVGAGNSYGHPKQAALNRLKTAGIAVYRTDQDGNVVFSTNGTKLTLPGNGGTVSGILSNTSSSGSSTSSSATDTFIGNKESKIFHLPTCSNLPDVSKRNYLYNYRFIVNCIGYTPCKVCLKDYVA